MSTQTYENRPLSEITLLFEGLLLYTIPKAYKQKRACNSILRFIKLHSYIILLLFRHSAHTFRVGGMPDFATTGFYV